MLINKASGTKKFQAGCFAFHNSGLNFVRIISCPKQVVSNNYGLQQAVERMSLFLFLIVLVCFGEEWLGNVFLEYFPFDLPLLIEGHTISLCFSSWQPAQ